jgi:hypothetical protein
LAHRLCSAADDGPWRSSGAASHIDAGGVVADFEERPWAHPDVVTGQKQDADRLEARLICTAIAGTGARRSASKSSIAHSRTKAAAASFATDQPGSQPAERHWVAEIIAIGRAEVGIVITSSVTRRPHGKGRPDEISGAILPGTNKYVVKPICGCNRIKFFGNWVRLTQAAAG